MKPLNFAIIGGGNIGRVHMDAISHIPDARVSVVCDVSQERGCALAAACDACWVANYEETVQRPDVDVVSICTPSGTHAEVAIAAARAGKHIVVEKPIDVTLSRVDQIIAAAAEAGVKLACIFPLRFMKGTHYAKEAVAAGRLGRLTLVDAYIKWHRPQSYYTGSWRGTWALDGGGALMNQGIHSIDLLQWFGGPISTIYGHTATLAHEMETEDTAAAVLSFRNGAIGVIEAATSSWPGDEARVELHGDQGTIALEQGRIVRWKLADAQPGEEEQMLSLEGYLGSGAQDPMGISYELHRRQLQDMVAAIRENRAPAVDGAEGRKAVEIIRAIYWSARTGQTAHLPLVES